MLKVSKDSFQRQDLSGSQFLKEPRTAGDWMWFRGKMSPVDDCSIFNTFQLGSDHPAQGPKHVPGCSEKKHEFLVLRS